MKKANAKEEDIMFLFYFIKEVDISKACGAYIIYITLFLRYGNLFFEKKD